MNLRGRIRPWLPLAAVVTAAYVFACAVMLVRVLSILAGGAQ